MQGLRRAAMTLALGLSLGAVPATAQFYRWDFNVNGGYSWLTGSVLDRRDFDFFDDDIDVDLEDSIGLDNGFILGSQIGYWFSPRFGLRGNFAWTKSGLQGRRNIFDVDTLELFGFDVSLMGLTADGMVRLNTPRERWEGFEWLPYITLGLGAQWIDPADHDFRVVVDTLGDEDDGIVVAPIRCNALLDRCAVLEDGTKLTGLLGIGMDFRFSPSFAARLEFGDRFWSAPVEEVIVDPDFPFLFTSTRDLDRTVNQLYLTLGFAFLFGLEEVAPVPVSVVQPPPQPAPQPVANTETITVCVVDPSDAQGLRISTATRNLQTGDTTVARNGQSVRLSEAVGNVPVAENSAWYIRGAPLVIGVAPRAMQYVPTGTERHMEPGALAYIGTVNGVPLFADRNTVRPGLTNLGPNTDLSRLVMQSDDARRALEATPLLYIPLRATGCAFQALQKLEEVRKKD